MKRAKTEGGSDSSAPAPPEVPSPEGTSLLPPSPEVGGGGDSPGPGPSQERPPMISGSEPAASVRDRVRAIEGRGRSRSPSGAGFEGTTEDFGLAAEQGGVRVFPMQSSWTGVCEDGGTFATGRGAE
eukprot:2366849-Pyramimonas_sp.AAC.1